MITLHYHPLASYCWKVLVALYENETPFTKVIVDLGNPESAASFKRLWPIGKFPVLRDDARNQTVPESTILIDYLDQHYPGSVSLIPADRDRARDARLQDRFFDAYVHEPMQKIVGDKLRPEGAKDPFGVAQARAQLDVAYAMIDDAMKDRRWAIGDDFTLADCAAAPALYYANLVHPLGAHAHTKAYLDRLVARPSCARVLAEAQPYFHLFPG